MGACRDLVVTAAAVTALCLVAPAKALAGAEQLPGPPLPEEAASPPGTKDDVLLWKQAVDSQNELVIQRRRAEALLREFRRGRHDGRLAELVAGAPESDRQRLHQVRKRLGFAWRQLSEVMSRQWPVDPRLRCRRQQNDFASALQAAPDSSAAGNLPVARIELKGCLQKLQSVLEPLQKGAAELAGAFAEADAVLGRPGAAAPQPAPAGRKPAGAGPAGD